MKKVGVEAQAGIDSDHAGVCCGVIAGVFERFPRAFEKHPVLWIHQLGFLGIDSEEIGVKQVGILKDAARAHILAAVRLGTAREPGDPAFSGDEVLPEFIGILCTGESARHSYDGYSFRSFGLIVH